MLYNGPELIQAAFEGDIQECQRLLDQEGADVNVKDETDGFTATFIANKLRRTECAEFLKERGGVDEAPDSIRLLPQSWFRLLSSVAKTYPDTDSNDIVIISRDYMLRSLDDVKQDLLTLTACIDKIHSRNLSIIPTELFSACTTKSWQKVEEILNSKPNYDLDASPTVGNQKGMTALWVLCGTHKVDLAFKMLDMNPKLNLDASPDEGELKGMTAFWIACANNNTDLAMKMLEINPKLDVNASPVEGTDMGKTPLWIACANKNWDLAMRILEINPELDVNASPVEGVNKGKTPLWFAAKNEKWDFARKLFEHGAALPEAKLSASLFQKIGHNTPFDKLKEIKREVGEVLSHRVSSTLPTPAAA